MYTGYEVPWYCNTIYGGTYTCTRVPVAVQCGITLQSKFVTYQMVLIVPWYQVHVYVYHGTVSIWYGIAIPMVRTMVCTYAMSTRAVVPHRDWRRRPKPRSKRRSAPTKTTSSRLSWRQVDVSVRPSVRTYTYANITLPAKWSKATWNTSTQVQRGN